MVRPKSIPKKQKNDEAAAEEASSSVVAAAADSEASSVVPPLGPLSEDNAAANKVGKKQRKKRRVKQGVKALREIKALQTSTKPLLLKAPFRRVVREIASTFHSDTLRFQESAMDALQMGAEDYLTQLYEDAYKHVTLKTRRKTLSVADLKTVRALRRREGASNSSAPITFE